MPDSETLLAEIAACTSARTHWKACIRLAEAALEHGWYARTAEMEAIMELGMHQTVVHADKVDSEGVEYSDPRGCFAALSIGAYGHIFRESEAWALHRAQALLGLVMLVMWSSTLTRVVFSVLPGLGPQMLIFQRMVVDVGKCTSAGLYYDRLALLLLLYLPAETLIWFSVESLSSCTVADLDLICSSSALLSIRM